MYWLYVGLLKFVRTPQISNLLVYTNYKVNRLYHVDRLFMYGIVIKLYNSGPNCVINNFPSGNINSGSHVVNALLITEAMLNSIYSVVYCVKPLE